MHKTFKFKCNQLLTFEQLKKNIFSFFWMYSYIQMKQTLKEK